MQNSGIEVLFEGSNFERLLGGLLVTIEISFVSIVIGTVLGIVMGLLRTLNVKPLQALLRLYLEAFRIIPILVWLYVVHFSFTPLLNIDISGETTSILVFSLWGAAEIGDIVRGRCSPCRSIRRNRVQRWDSAGGSCTGMFLSLRLSAEWCLAQLTWRHG